LSCEVQENLNESNNKRNILVEDFSLRSIQGKTTSKLLETANKIKSLNATAANSKTVYNAAFDFYMEDEHGIHVVIDGQDSYTFEITRTSGDQKVENIIFNEKVDGSFETLLIKYDYSKEEFNSLPYQEILNKNKTGTVINTDNGTVSSTSRLCTFVLEDEPIPAYGANGYLKMTFVYVCPEDESGGGGGDGPKTQTGWGGNGVDTGPSNGNGNTGNNNNNNPTGSNQQSGGTGVTTTPVVNLVPTPCSSLKKISDPTKGNIQPAFDYLTSTFSNSLQGQENGYSFQVSPVATVGYVNLPVLPTVQESSITMPTGPYIYGGVHTHTEGQEDIFSLNDMAVLYNYYVTAPLYRDDTVFMLQNENGSIYAIKIENASGLEYFLNEYFNDPKYSSYSDRKKQLILNDKFNAKIKKNSGISNDRKRGFLEAIKDSGALLFEKTATGWSNVTLPEFSSQPLIKTPCPQ
jgi:hypothetical protein